MKQILKLMNRRAMLLKKAIRLAERDTGTFEEGRLRISMDRGLPRYYQVTEDSGQSGTYLSRSDLSIAGNLAQKDYNRVFLDEARKELARLERSIRQFSKENADTAYTGLSEPRQKLITPYLLTEEKYAETWLKMNYKTNPYKPEEKIYDTDRGEKVRSKSEAFIADILFELGIPYRYEQALTLKNGTTKYPDFTMLNVRTKEIIYLEHLGLLDAEIYRSENLHKFDEYRANKIFIGKNLLITYETKGSPFDINGTRDMLKEIFCK